MNISVAQPTRFKRMFEVLKELYTDLEIQFEHDSFGFKSVDRNRVCLGHLRVNNLAEHFPIYQLEKPVKICINLQQFCTVLHPVKNEHTLSLSVPADQIDQPQELVIVMEDTSQQGGNDADYTGDKRTATIKLSNPEGDEDSIDNLMFERTVQIDSGKLRSYIGDLVGISEKVSVTINDRSMVLYCQSDRMAYDLKIGCRPIEPTPAANALPGPVLTLPGPIEPAQAMTGIYPLNYMKLFVKAQDLSSQVLLSLSNKGPMLWRFVMGEYGILEFFLAPIVTESNGLDAPGTAAPAEEEVLLV